MGRPETFFRLWKPRSFLAARDAAALQNLPDPLFRHGLLKTGRGTSAARNVRERRPVPLGTRWKRRADSFVDSADFFGVAVCLCFPCRTSFLGERLPVISPFLEDPGLPFKPRDQIRHLGPIAFDRSLESSSDDPFDQIDQDGFLGGVEVFEPWSPAIAVRLVGMIHFVPLHVLEDPVRKGPQFFVQRIEAPVQDPARLAPRRPAAVRPGRMFPGSSRRRPGFLEPLRSVSASPACGRVSVSPVSLPFLLGRLPLRPISLHDRPHSVRRTFDGLPHGIQCQPRVDLR